MFELITNWQDVLTKAWSVRLIILAAVLSGAEAGLPLVIDSYPLPTGVLALVSMIVSGAALYAHTVAQKGLSK